MNTFILHFASALNTVAVLLIQAAGMSYLKDKTYLLPGIIPVCSCGVC